MKTKILLFSFLLITGICNLQSQCTVNPFNVSNLAAGAISPPALHFCVDDIVSNLALQVMPMSEYTFGGTLFQVDSFQLDNVINMPPWMDYICHDPANMFRAGIWTCMAINCMGTIPNVLGTDTVKLYEIALNISAWTIVGGSTVNLLVTPDDHYKIWVHPANSYRWWENTGNMLYNNISGKAYFDVNQNGAKDPSEPYIPNQKALLLPDSIIAYTNHNGEYNYYVDSGSYSVQYIPQGIWLLSSANSSYTLTTDSSITTVPDFGVWADDTAAIAVTLSSGISRCNSTTPYWFYYKNEGTRTENGVISFIPDLITSFLDDYPFHDSASNGYYFWHFDNLLPGEERQISIYLSMPGLTNVGDTVVSCSFLRAANINKADTLKQIFVCSYDPNDKTVYPFGEGTEKYTLMNETLRYTIRFQNTGNDTAFNITVKDTLSPYLDVSSFQLLASSHPVNTNLKASGALLFRFDNIMLPDSGRNMDLSQGYITYSIKPKAGLANHTEIRNTSYIFFDYNPAVQTNTTLNTMVYTIPQGIEEKQLFAGRRLSIYPNPTNGQIKITVSVNCTSLHLSIFNAQGLEIYRSEKLEKELDVKLPAAGLYLVKGYNGDEVLYNKIIVY